MARVNHLARALKTGHDPRTIDQLRADVFLDLLEGNQAADGVDRRGVVDIRVDLTTLMGLADTPGEIGGWGPVIADIIRRAVSERDTWQITVTDNGDIAWVGTTRRRPTTRQQRQIRARRPVCVFPGCRMPATNSDLDHTIAYADGGPTAAWNIAPLCRHDHRAKHQGGWKLQRIAPNRYQWTSPHNHTYIVEAEPP